MLFNQEKSNDSFWHRFFSLLVKPKTMKPLATILVVLGIVMMIITGVNIATKKEVVDLGKIEISKTENHPISWSPIVGGVLLIAGAALFLVSRKKMA